MALTLQRTYPLNYPEEAVKVLKAMSFTKGENIIIVGSASLRSQQYAGDYDANELVKVDYKTDEEAVNALASEFKAIIRRLTPMKNVYIGDIKCGVIEEWKAGSIADVKRLLDSKIITEAEANETNALLKDTSKIGRLRAEAEIKFHIVRWTPKQILAGKQVLRDGRTYTLQEALHSPTITKLDVIAVIQQRYTEISVIYEFKNGSKSLNPSKEDVEKSLKNSIALYEAEGNKFKAIKRKFSLAKLKNNKANLKRYSNIINSEAGKIYIVYSDVKTLAEALESHTLPSSALAEAIDGFKTRLSRIYQYDKYLASEPKLIADLLKATTSNNPAKILKNTEETLFTLLNSHPSLKGGIYII